MTTVEARANIPVPVGTAYDLLEEMESLPLLIDCVHDVRKLPHATVLRVEFDDHCQQWELNVVDEAPGRHITWDRVDGPGSAEIRLRPAGPRGTALTILVYDPDDPEACQEILDAQLAKVVETVQQWADDAGTTWGVVAPW